MSAAVMQGWKSNTNGTDLWNMLQQSFGWVTSSGYTSKGNITTQFPVVIGEFGSNYVDPLVSHCQRRDTLSCKSGSAR